MKIILTEKNFSILLAKVIKINTKGETIRSWEYMRNMISKWLLTDPQFGTKDDSFLFKKLNSIPLTFEITKKS